MSEYCNFINDFPGRCTDVLDSFSPNAQLMDREVTLTLAVAAAALMVPFERLRLSGGAKEPHPSGDRDRPEFRDAKDHFDTLLGQPFLGSSLWHRKDPRSWQYGSVDKAQLEGDVERWGPRDGESLATIKLLCGELLLTLRNGLAHGNIWIKPESGGISRLIFVRVPHGSPTAYFAAVTPVDFGALLKSWVEFLRANTLPKDVVEESEHFSAAAA